MAYYHSNGSESGGGGSLRALGGEYSGDEHESRSVDEERIDRNLNDKPIYLLEHLATFTVNKEAGIVYPADGMRRLLQLEKTTGIWSQKMQLCLDFQWLLIMDYETGNIIERFPASLIQEPTAFTSTDAMELYNNILVFIVSSGSGSRSEMHIFQSQNVSAVHLVEDLKNLRSGKMVTQQREPNFQMGPTPSQLSKSMIPINRQHNRHNIVERSVIREASHGRGEGGGANDTGNGDTDSDIGGANDEISSTSSDKYERDVTVLNHCFDDIEKFIARLQHAAAALRELERRRRNRKTKKKDPGEGLLTLRTRPPHEKEFLDIFAKFKLSFNLLAKLKAHIHDPNAPELVHFLFTPLALIVEASSDTYYESQLPARAVNPLLTREAINLLINCVTSKETELWRSLGDAWIIPRDQWKENVGSYHPVFLDGWSPDYLVVDELEPAKPSTPTNMRKRSPEMHHTGIINAPNVGSGAAGNYDEYGGSVLTLSEKYKVHNQLNKSDGNEFGARSEGSIDSVDRNSAIQLLGDNNMGANDAMMHSITASLHNLNTSQGGGGGGGGGDYAGEAISQSENRMNSNTGTAYAVSSGAPKNDSESRMLGAWLDELQTTGAKIVLVTYPRTANNDKELSVVRGEFLEIIDDTRKWWKARNVKGQVAHVPHTIVTPFNYGSKNVSNNFYGQQQQQQQRQQHHQQHQQQHQQEQQQHHQQMSNIYARNSTNTLTGSTLDEVEQEMSDSTQWIRKKVFF